MQITKHRFNLHIRALWSAPLLFVSIITSIAVSENQNLLLAAAAEQAGLSFIYSYNP